MKTRLVLVVVLLTGLLCGCKTYEYAFKTTIFEDGGIERTITFTQPDYEAPESQDAAPSEKAAPSENAEVPEGAAATAQPLPTELIVPDKSRFDHFEILENGFTGTWRSDGKIHGDFRFTHMSFTSPGTPLQRVPRPSTKPLHVRQAYNEGVVTVSDFAIVKTVNYVERFNDFYTRAEFECYGDTIVDILADLFLETLHKDLDRQYDFRAFDELVEQTLAPLAKKWKYYLYRELVEGGSNNGEERPELSAILEPEKLGLAHDLVRLGILEDPYFDGHLLVEKFHEWLVAKLHEKVVRKDNGAPWPEADIKEYLSEEGAFSKSLKKLTEKRYGEEDAFGKYLEALFDSFALTVDRHDFLFSVTAPGPVIHVVPEPDFISEEDGDTIVKWSFRERHFFPDGVLLSVIAAVPVEGAQKRLFNGTVLDDPDDMARYVLLLQHLPTKDREAFLETLRECVKEGSLEKLTDFARERIFDAPEAKTPEDLVLWELLQMLDGLATPGGEE